MRKEADVKEAVKKILNDLGAYWYMPVQTGYGVKGIPDFIVCLNGRFIAIETKFGINSLTAWQDKQLRKIEDAKGRTFVIYEHNIAPLRAYLEAIGTLEG